MSIKPITLILNNLSIKNDKINESISNPIEPKKRGRPKKNNIITSEKKPIEPKKRGRPKKNTASNREELIQITELKEPRKRGRPKKNITIANDTSSESSVDNNEPKKRGRPKKIETIKVESDDSEESDESDDSDESDESDDSDSESENNGEEVEGFYIKLDKNATRGYIFVSSVSESEYIIRPNFKLYNPHTFIYCGTWDPIRGKPQ